MTRTSRTAARLLFIASLVTVALLHAGRAAADDDDGPRLYLVGTFEGGFGGKSRFDGSDEADLSEPLAARIGGGGRVQLRLHRYLGMGAHVVGSTWDALDPFSSGRSRILDVYGEVRARYPVDRGMGEYYLSFRAGWSHLMLGQSDLDAGAALETDDGYALGAHIGVSAHLTPHFGGLLELGWTRHAFKDVATVDGATVDLATNQFTMAAGYFVSF